MITNKQVAEVYHLPLMDLVCKAHEVHKEHFDPMAIQASQLLSIKTGGCPENCSYCPQSAHYDTGVEKQSLMSIKEVTKLAEKAKKGGASRFCMGAAWREVKDGPEFEQVIETVKAVKNLDLEVCCTLGMLNSDQATKLKKAGLHAYNHNIDTSKSYYSDVISTRNFEDRMRTIQNVRDAGITVCTGGILGMGETEDDRISFLETLVNLSPQPESITINTLVRTKGTPLESLKEIDPTIVVRVVASARILAPKSMIRLSAGRMDRTELEQFLLFYVGANSIFLGDTLLTSPNPETDIDKKMFENLDLSFNQENV